MATFRRRGNKWHVQVCRKGYKPLTLSFCLKDDALQWARSMEIKVDRHEKPEDQVSIQDKTLSDLLQKYLDEVTPKKRTADNEAHCLKAFMQFDIAKKQLIDITAADFATFRDQRLRKVKGSSFNREIGRIQSAYEVAIREWDWPLKENPVKRIRKPPNEPARQRRLTPMN